MPPMNFDIAGENISWSRIKGGHTESQIGYFRIGNEYKKRI